MQAFKVRLFELPRVQAATLPVVSPKELPGFAVDADDIDSARNACRKRLTEWGYEIRTVSCLAGASEAQLAATVYEKTKKDASIARSA